MAERNLPFLAGFFSTFLVLTASARAADPDLGWTQWRGPTRDGQVVGPAWPDSL